MKILLISDVHSNIHALRAIEQQEKAWDVVLFAGDMVDYGLQPKEVVCWMRDHNAIAVAGNHDISLVSTYRNHFIPKENPLQATSFCEHNLSLLSEEDVEYIASLPLEITVTLDDVTYFMTHIYDPQDEEALFHHLQEYHTVSFFEAFWQQKVGDTKGKRCLVLGHNHHCLMLQLKKDTFIISPGSAAYKLGNDVHAKGAHYVVIEDGVPSFRFVDFDFDQDYKVISEQMNQLEKTQKNVGLAIFGLSE